MRNFTLITYEGEDAGEVLCTILSNGFKAHSYEDNVHDLEAKTQIGFRPNPEEDDEDDED